MMDDAKLGWKGEWLREENLQVRQGLKLQEKAWWEREQQKEQGYTPSRPYEAKPSHCGFPWM